MRRSGSHVQLSAVRVVVRLIGPHLDVALREKNLCFVLDSPELIGCDCGEWLVCLCFVRKCELSKFARNEVSNRRPDSSQVALDNGFAGISMPPVSVNDWVPARHQRYPHFG